MCNCADRNVDAINRIKTPIKKPANAGFFINNEKSIFLKVSFLYRSMLFRSQQYVHR